MIEEKSKKTIKENTKSISIENLDIEKILKDEIIELEKKLKEQENLIMLKRQELERISLRKRIKNELKATIIQKILNTPDSKKIRSELPEILNEILQEINFKDDTDYKNILKEKFKSKIRETYNDLTKPELTLVETFEEKIEYIQ